MNFVFKLFFLSGSLASTLANILLSNIYSDNMIIQNPGGVIIGFASPNVIITTTVSFRGYKLEPKCFHL